MMNIVKRHTTSVIIVAGGTGTRMQSSIPKQFLPVKGKPIIHYSIEVFLSIPEIEEIIIVCDPSYQSLIQDCIMDVPSIRFALPGARRQDSVFNGLQKASPSSEFICIHDSARPFITTQMVKDILDAGFQHGAAVAAMPVKFTIKESDSDQFVNKTPDRSRLWEIQTPQMAKAHLLHEGFRFAYEHDLTVTDDVSLVELIKHPVKIVKGSYTNLKITTPEDLQIAEHFASNPKQLGTC